MNIIKKTYTWNGILSKRYLTNYIVLHHRAGDGDVESIHKQHLSQTWTGIGYHFYIRKDGKIYEGRPINTWGAHCIGYNDKSVGVCFEGNFEIEKPTKEQIKSGQKLVQYLKDTYPQAKVVGHKDLYATACPGKKFPIEEIKKGVTEMTLEKAIEIVKTKAVLEQQTIDFLLCYKYGEQLIIKLAKAMEG